MMSCEFYVGSEGERGKEGASYQWKHGWVRDFRSQLEEELLESKRSELERQCVVAGEWATSNEDKEEL